MSNPLNSEGNGWPEYRREVMASLSALRDDVKGVEEQVARLREDMAGIKVKTGLFGAMAGMIPASIAIIWHYLSGRSK